MPRYSATSGVENPAVNTPSTSERLSPASSSAFSAASACSWIADRSGTWPIRSDSAAPTIATRPEIGSDIAVPPVEDAVGQLGELVVAHRPDRGRPRDVERALQVDRDDRVPVVLGHVEDHAVAQDASAVDDHVDLAVLSDARLDQVGALLGVRDVPVVGDRQAPGRLDLVDDLLGRPRVLALPLQRRAEVA